MKKTLATIFGALMLLATFGVAAASAAPGDNGKAGPNDHNGKGLCTAYFNGQKNGHDKDGDGDTDNSPAFQGLEDAASEYDEANFAEGDENNEESENREDERQISDDVFEYCNNMWEIMGNPEHNGRFDCREGEDREGTPHDSDGDGEVECDPIADPEA